MDPMNKPRCGAKTKGTGQPCKRYPVPGAKRCVKHGAGAPQVRRAAQLRLVEQQARELFGQFVPEATPVDNPLAAYAAFAGRVMAWMELMDSLLDDLRSVGYESEHSGEQIAAAVQLYERAMDRTNTVLSAYARLNIDARLAAINEQQIKTVVGAIDAVIRFLGADGPRAQQARAIGARHLTLAAA